MAILVSVIIPTYNRAGLLPRAINSVLAQSFKDFELWVVDDGSSDATASVIRQYSDPRLHYLALPHRGVSAARNAGAQAAQAAWIAFLDSDDEWHPDKLAKQWRYHESHPHLKISQTNDRWIRGGLLVTPPKKLRKKSGNIFVDSLSRCMISPSAVLLQKALFWDCGGFPEDFPACEDYALWLRITHQHDVGLLPEALVTRYAGHSDQLSALYPAMDRFRISALEKILTFISDDAIREKVLAILAKKCFIVSQGSLKRGRLLQWWVYYRKQKKYRLPSSTAA